MEQAAVCKGCGAIGLVNAGDGHFYCPICGVESQDLMEEAVEDRDFDRPVDGRFVVRMRESQPEPDLELTQRLQMLSSFQRLTQTNANAKEEQQEEEVPGNAGFSSHVQPFDFPPPPSQSSMPVVDEAEVAEQLRNVYLEGIQIMLQMQCEALVTKFGVSPLICGIVAPIWLRFIASSTILQDGWHDKAKMEEDADAPFEGPRQSVKYTRTSKYKSDFRTECGKKTVHVWIRALKRTIPLSSSLSICFIACHVSREAILPTDIVRWALEAEIPYLSVFVDIEKRLSSSFNIRSVKSSLLFRPSQVIDSWQLESSAGLIAKNIGLHLPPVNFFSIATRYLKMLPVVTDKVLPCACHIYEWSMPPDLWIPSHHSRLPSRVCVMSILVLAIRLTYNIGGYSYWERSLDIRKKKYRKRKLKEKDASFSSDDMQASNATEFSGNPHAADGALGDLFETPKHKPPVKKRLRIVKNKHQKHSLSKEKNASFSSGDMEASNVADGKTRGPHDEDTTLGNSSETAKRKAPLKKLLHNSCSESDAMNLLRNIDIEYKIATSGHEHPKDLQSYIEYCKDVIFADKTAPFDEENLISSLWTQFQKKEEVINPLENMDARCTTDSIPSALHKIPKDVTDEVGVCNPRSTNQGKNDTQMISKACSSRRELISLQTDMEKHGFLYTFFRRDRESSKYLHYKRTAKYGKLRYIVHADYYILLRTCARIVEVDARVLHLGLLKLERRLRWIEKRIDHSLPSVFRLNQ